MKIIVAVCLFFSAAKRIIALENNKKDKYSHDENMKGVTNKLCLHYKDNSIMNVEQCKEQLHFIMIETYSDYYEQLKYKYARPLP